MSQHKRHAFIWSLLFPLVRLWARIEFNFTAVPSDVKGPYLVLANHVTSFDPVLAALSFREQMYFVSSEHVFRHGLWSRLLVWAFSPISKLKGSSGADTVMAIMRRLRAGNNVCLFAEGSCTWDGVTGDFLPATGKLARSCGATLVTYRLEGGYLTRPRWANGNTRKGKMTGRVVGVYSRDELRRMTAEEINAIISRDIYEDAYARQQAEPVAYRSKSAAENLEAVLCLCPRCGGLDTMHSHGRMYTCSCGYSVTFNEFGRFEGADGESAVYDNITDWVAWQRRRLRELCHGDDFSCSDTGIHVTEVLEGHRNLDLGTGEFALTRDALSLGALTFPLSEVTGIALRSTCFINLSVAGRNFELGAKSVWCAWKYMVLFSELTKQAIRTN